MKVRDILKATGGRLIRGGLNAPVGGFSIDSRTIKAREVFIAIKGRRFNGHDFIGEAVKKGASGVIVSGRKAKAEHPAPIVIKVGDTALALGAIAGYKRTRSKTKVVAITGSNGKTTTKDMVAHILSKRSTVLSTRGTENNAIGLPLSLLRLKEERYCVLELGMNRFGEIDYLSRLAKPDVGVITNIGPCHLRRLGSLENVCEAKLELVKHISKNGVLIINGDDTRLAGKCGRYSIKVIRFGFGSGNDFRAGSAKHGNGKLEFYVNGNCKIMLKLLGAHNVYNALAAISTACVFGIGVKAAREALRDFKPAAGRLELKTSKGIKFIDDTYNANPVSMDCAVKTLAGYKTKGRRILVAGDMLELGGMSRRFHEAVADMYRDSGIDMLITVGERSYGSYMAAKKQGINKKRLRHFGSAKEAGRRLRDIAREGDVVLIKGSRDMKMEEAIKCFTTSSIR